MARNDNVWCQEKIEKKTKYTHPRILTVFEILRGTVTTVQVGENKQRTLQIPTKNNVLLKACAIRGAKKTLIPIILHGGRDCHCQQESTMKKDTFLLWVGDHHQVIRISRPPHQVGEQTDLLEAMGNLVPIMILK